MINYALGEYTKAYGPLSLDRRQIADALFGANPGKEKYLERGYYRCNFSGELIDPWGTPFQFKRDGQQIIAGSSHIDGVWLSEKK